MIKLRTAALTLLAAGSCLATGLAVGATSASASTPACGNSSLTVTQADPEGATGHGSVILLFRNVSAHTCTIYGYPGLDALNSSGHVLAHAKRTLHGFAGGPSKETTATLAPGKFASAVVEWMNFNPVTSGPCTISKSIATTPANTTHTVKLPVSVSVCDLQIHPTVAGANGNTQFGYAQAQWIHGSKANAATEGNYWKAAQADLAYDGSRYSTQIAELKALRSLPNTDLTKAQDALYIKSVTELDNFFGTPKYYL
jgi:hypothetical protein